MGWFSNRLSGSQKEEALAMVRHLQIILAYQQLAMETYNDAAAIAMGDVKIPYGAELTQRAQFNFSNPTLVAQYVTPAIAKKIEMPEKHVRYHYRAHLVGSKIIDGYVVRWQGDKYHSDNKYIFSCFIEFTDINQKDMVNIFKVIENIPFTWFISLSVDKTHLVSQFFVPVTFYYDFLAYLSNRLNVYKEKYELFIVDIDSAKAYTLPFESYNDKTGWNTDIDELISFFRDKVRAVSKSYMTDYVEK